MNQYRTAGILDENALCKTSKHFLARLKESYPGGTRQKDYLTPEQRKSFLPFLTGKCPKLKVVK